MAFAETLKQVDERHRKLLKSALEPEPSPLPRAIDIRGLFSTERDLHGGFTDVSSFVRNTDPDADLIVFWRVWQGARPPRGSTLDGPPFDLDSEGCPVAFYTLSEMLKQQRARAWIWNDEDALWETCAPNDLRPGMVVMLHRDVGGYSADVGWTGEHNDTLLGVPTAGPGRALAEDERAETGEYVPLNVHLKDTEAEAVHICNALGLSQDLRTAVVQAAAFHDIGKAHPRWQLALPTGCSMRGEVWAKCPRVLGLDVPFSDPEYGQAVTCLRPDALALPTLVKRPGGLRLRWIVGQTLTRQELKQLSGLPSVQWAGHSTGTETTEWIAEHAMGRPHTFSSWYAA